MSKEEKKRKKKVAKTIEKQYRELNKKNKERHSSRFGGLGTIKCDVDEKTLEIKETKEGEKKVKFQIECTEKAPLMTGDTLLETEEECILEEEGEDVSVKDCKRITGHNPIGYRP